MIANPLIRYLEQHVKIVRKHSSVVLIAGVLALIILAFYGLIGWIVRTVRGFILELPELYATMVAELSLAYSNLSAKFSFLPSDVEESFVRLIDAMGTGIGDFVQGMATSASGAVVRVLPDVLVYTVVILLSSYLFLAEHDKIINKIKEMMPKSLRKYASFFKQDVKTLIYGYFLAQFKIMFVVAVVIFVGLMILGVRYSVILAIGIALLDFLPMFGTGTVLIPWAIVKLITGEYFYAIGLIALYVLSQAIRQVIQPKIVGDSMGLPPLTTLFLLFLGYKFKGLAGMILAVPVGMIFIKFYEYGAFDSFKENVKLLVDEIERLRKGE